MPRRKPPYLLGRLLQRGEQSDQPQLLLRFLLGRAFRCPDPNHLFSASYRWAVSSVMTRQNQIPTEDGSRVTLALIPLWDMCNHTNGLVMTSAALCLIREAIVVKLESGHSTYKPFSPLIASSKGSRHPSRCPQTGWYFSLLVLLNPSTDREPESDITFESRSELHLFVKPSFQPNH